MVVLNDVLDLAKIEANRITLNVQPIDLKALITAIAALHRFNSSAKGVELITALPDEPCEIESDPVRLRQVLDNLLSNAVKFTHEGRITIRLQEQHDQFVISVQDSGIGIAPEELTRIFEPFYQAENFLTRHHRGTGLGLPLARRMVELMGGKLDVDAIQGTGSTFTVTLPHTPPDVQHTES